MYFIQFSRYIIFIIITHLICEFIYLLDLFINLFSDSLPRAFLYLYLFYLLFCQHDLAPLFITCNPVFEDILYPVVFKVIFISGILDLF